jgi:hypothetical protein
VALLVPAAAVAGEIGAAERPNVRLVGEAGRRALTRALVAAADRLSRPECEALLGEFRDGEGRTLQENLTELGVDAPGYLATVLFYDGYRNGRCAKRDVIALTTPGARVVFVCHGFYQRWLHEPDFAEAVLIHEALHTLGLGENPPSSREITGRVLDRCMGGSLTSAQPVVADRTNP